MEASSQAGVALASDRTTSCTACACASGSATRRASSSTRTTSLYLDVAFTEFWRERLGGYARDDRARRRHDARPEQPHLSAAGEGRTRRSTSASRAASLGTTSMALEAIVERDGEPLVEATLHLRLRRRLRADEDARSRRRSGPLLVLIDSPRAAGRSSPPMRFSLYSEIQLHPGKSPQQLYAEVLEQIVNADRLGYDVYAMIEHYFFPKFSISPNPTALFAAAAQRTQRHPLPHDAARAAVPQPHGARERRSTRPTSSPAAATNGASAAATAGSRCPPASRSTSTRGRGTRRRSTCCSKALENERFSHEGTYFHVDDSHVVPFVDSKYRVYLGGTSDRTYTLAAERGWGVAVPPLLPYAALEQQMDLYRESCAEHGTEPDIVWIHACHLDEDRETAHPRGARAGSTASSRATPRRSPSGRAAGRRPEQGGLRLLRRRDHGRRSREIPYEKLIEDDYVWVGTPQDIIERIEATRKRLRRHPGDRHHRQRRRCSALDGDQEPGALRERRHAARRRMMPRALIE